MLPKICIPSFNRHDLLKSKTLAFLKKEGYPSELIYIFVATQDEFERYQTVLPTSQIILGLPGLKQQRRYICDFLFEDEIYISMDDDVENVKSLNKSFLTLVSDGVAAIESRRTGLFGILPNDNGMCFKDNTTEHLAFILGALYISRNHQDMHLEGPCETDDYERTILYFLRYGRVFRYRGSGIKTRYQGTSGGSTGGKERKAEGVRELLLKYPGACSYRDKKGEPDLLLNWHFKSNLE